MSRFPLDQPNYQQAKILAGYIKRAAIFSLCQGHLLIVKDMQSQLDPNLQRILI